MTGSSVRFRLNCLGCSQLRADMNMLWFDTDGRPTMWDPPTTYPLVHGVQPQILINNRLEMGTHEEWVRQGQLRSNEDYYTPE